MFFVVLVRKYYDGGEEFGDLGKLVIVIIFCRFMLVWRRFVVFCYLNVEFVRG